MIKKRIVPAIFLLIGIIIMLTIYSGSEQEVEIYEEESGDAIAVDKEFGIEVNDRLIYKGEISTGQNLSLILNRYGVPPQKIDLVVRKSADIFDPRTIKAGNRYTMICLNDENKSPAYFIYEKSRTQYLVFALADSIHVYEGEKEVVSRYRLAEGIITSSLWNALAENYGNPLLSLDLSEIFAWSIDFYAINRGDEFKVIYDQLFVDDISVGNGSIHAAQFIHNGVTYNAYRYEQDNKIEYFNENGENLRRAFLKAPLRFSRISSRFSNSRMHPVLRIRRPHHGVDYAAPTGTPVQSIGDGTVISAHYAGGAGNMVKIRHNSVYTTAYLHLSRFGQGIKPGTRVKQGQLIGYVGSTGLSTGPHLDFRVYKNGQAIDPLTMESPPAEPVKPENMEDFQRQIMKLRAVLDGRLAV